MDPEVLYLLPCYDVHKDPDNYHRIDVIGLIRTIHSKIKPSFPLVHPLLRVLVILTASQRKGELVLRIIHDKTGRVIFRSLPRLMRFVGPPDEACGATFRIINCGFPMAGL